LVLPLLIDVVDVVDGIDGIDGIERQVRADALKLTPIRRRWHQQSQPSASCRQFRQL
jgi:hypothetical protein